MLLTGRDRAKLAHLAAELADADRPVRSVAADLATAEGRQAVIGFAEGQPIDLLINNAGVGHARARSWTIRRSANRRWRSSTWCAPVELTRALLPGMLKRAGEASGRGGLIFVASAAAFMPIPLFATYAASKAFLLHYAEALAEELSDAPVDVLALCPGATRTRFFERANIAAHSTVPAPMHERRSGGARGVAGPRAPGGPCGGADQPIWRRRRPASCPAGSSPPRPSGPCGGGSNPLILLTKHLSIS